MLLYLTEYLHIYLKKKILQKLKYLSDLPFHFTSSKDGNIVVETKSITNVRSKARQLQAVPIYLYSTYLQPSYL